MLLRVGERGHGLTVILKGQVAVTRRDGPERHEPINTHTPGSFMGELAQLSGRPALVDAEALETVEALVISPQGLRAVLVTEADLGETVMRALILRRVALLEVGRRRPGDRRAGRSSGVRRLAEFLTRNSHPMLALDSDEDPDARALLEPLNVTAGEWPIVFCAGGQVLRNPTEVQLARCIGLVGAIDADKVYDVAIVGAGPRGSSGVGLRRLGRPLGDHARLPRLWRPGGRFRQDRELPRLSDRHHRAGADGPRLQPGAEVRGRDGDSRRGGVADARRPRRADPAETDQRRDGAGLHRGACQRRPLPAARGAGDGGLRGAPRCTTGLRRWSARFAPARKSPWLAAGNSAGQAVVYLAAQARKVWLVVRGPGLEATMSRYLIDRIRGLANVELVTQAEIVALEGEDGALSAVRWRRKITARRGAARVRNLFLFIGADANTDWLASSGLAMDRQGFLITGGKGPPPAGDQPARRLRHRRHPLRLGQARRRGGRRGGRRWWPRSTPTWRRIARRSRKWRAGSRPAWRPM
ncbi:MAG: cyclic nucleotide-binding domain-containing protein [Caulobacteraceae bacterium]